MRDKVKRYYTNFQKALRNLRIVDGTLKRFEICYELAWKLMKSYLEDQNEECKSSRQCLDKALKKGLVDIEDKEEWYEMIDDRNLLVHTYTFEESRQIFERIKQDYLYLLEKFYNKISKKLTGDEL